MLDIRYPNLVNICYEIFEGHRIILRIAIRALKVFKLGELAVGIIVQYKLFFIIFYDNWSNSKFPLFNDWKCKKYDEVVEGDVCRQSIVNKTTYYWYIKFKNIIFEENIPYFQMLSCARNMVLFSRHKKVFQSFALYPVHLIQKNGLFTIIEPVDKYDEDSKMNEADFREFIDAENEAGNF